MDSCSGRSAICSDLEEVYVVVLGREDRVDVFVVNLLLGNGLGESKHCRHFSKFDRTFLAFTLSSSSSLAIRSTACLDVVQQRKATSGSELERINSQATCPFPFSHFLFSSLLSTSSRRPIKVSCCATVERSNGAIELTRI